VAWSQGPTAVRFPKTPLGPELPAARTLGDVDVLLEPAADAPVDVLVVAVGATAGEVLGAVATVRDAGFSVRVAAPTWVAPVPSELPELARTASLVVTVEDGSVVGGVGTRVAQAVAEAGLATPVRQIGVPRRFLAHGAVSDVRAEAGLSHQDIGRRIVEYAAVLADRTDTLAPRRVGDSNRTGER
jgi:1-deoxy-D-xylulose-5-phosphate synthase